MSATRFPILNGLSLHPDYYLPNGDLYFQVEQTIFRVHSHFFTRESPRFRERMAGAECARTSAHDGRTDHTAIPVKNTSVEEFSHFLWIFYDPTYMYNAKSPVWCSILLLSSPGRWDFPRIHALALLNLIHSSLPLVDRIVLYTNCSVSFEHLLPLYVELCTREASLSLEESVRLGFDLVAPISQVRESLLKGEGKTKATGVTQSIGTAVADVPKKWIRDQIRDRLNLTQDISSMIDTQKYHCPPHHEFDPHCVLTRVEKRGRHMNSSQLEEKSKASSSYQAFHQNQKMVCKEKGKEKGKGKAAANA